MKVLVAVLALFAVQSAQSTIIDTLQELGQTAILEWIELAGFTEALSGEGPFTGFVPKQEVIENLPQDLVDLITSDLDVFAQVLSYHVVPGVVLSSDLTNEALIPTLAGVDLRVNLYEHDGLSVVAINGVPIDLSNVDIEASNGVIHLLNYLMLDIPVGDTVATLQDLGGFSALEYAAQSLDLVGDLVAAEDITFLAPIDSDAFNTEVVDSLLADPEALAAILNDHVYSGTVYSIGIGVQKEFTSIGGNTVVVQFTAENGYVVNDLDGNLLADIISGDIPTTQGVVHILDRPIVL